MNLQNIREKLTKNSAYDLNNKQIIANWLAYECDVKFQFGLTLMPKKVFYKHVPCSKKVKDNIVFRHLSKIELEEAAIKFIETLNKVIYKNAYKRFHKKLDVVMAIEGERSKKDLHTHFALTKPGEMCVNEFAKRVRLALELSGKFEIFNPNYKCGIDSLDEQYRYKLDIIDSDWLYYITKELDKKSVHNLYLL